MMLDQTTSFSVPSGKGRTVSCLFPRMSQRHLASLGVPPDEYQRETGIDLAMLRMPGARIDAELLAREYAFSHRVGSTPAPDCEQLLEQVVSYSPPVGGAILGAPSVRQAVDSCIRFVPLLFGQDATLNMVRLGPDLLLQAIEGDPEQGPKSAPGLFLLVAAVLRHLDPDGRIPLVCHLPVLPPQPYLRGLEAILCAKVRPGAAHCGLRVPAMALARPTGNRNQVLFGLFTRTAETELARLSQVGPFSLQVEQIIRELMTGEGSGLGERRILSRLCARLAVSEWRLRRRLALERTGFRQLFRSVQISEARRLLADADLSVREVGERLRFSSQSAFTRFFHGAVGTAPLAYRRELHG